MSKEVFARLLRLAAPLAVVQLGYQLLGAVDTAVAGRLDATSLSATGIASSLFFAVSALGLGIGIALDPLIAQALGAEDKNKARNNLWVGLVILAVLSVPLAAAILWVTFNLDKWGVPREVARLAGEYTWARLPSLLPFLLALGLRSWLQAERITKPILWAVFATNVVNLLGDLLLVYGDVGLSRIGLPGVGLESLGVAGIGWSTTFSAATQFLVLLSFCGPALPAVWAPFKSTVWRILDVGSPVALHVAAEIGVFATFQVLAGRMGEVSSAAHQTAITIAAASFSICIGVGAATCVEVGRAVGARQVDEVRRAGFAGMSLGTLVMFLFAIAMWVVPESLARLLTDEPEVIELAATLLRIAGFFQLVDGLQAVASGALRGLTDTRYAFVVNLVAHWLFGLPFGLFLAYPMGMGVAGLWWGMTLALTLVGVLVVRRFRRLSALQIV